MHLTRERLEEYIDLVCPDQTSTERALVLEKFQEKVDLGRADLRNSRVLIGRDDRIAAAMHLVQHCEDEWILTEVVYRRGRAPDDEALAELVRESMQRARELQARSVLARVNLAVLTPAYRRALEAEGFAAEGERLEFQAPLDDLPREEDSPFDWQTMAEVGFERSAALLAQVAHGDPMGCQERDNPEGALRTFLGEPNLVTGARCIHMGLMEDQPVAFVMAQVDPATGISRINYMGLVPELRGRGLGRAIFLHGLTMLRQQGGNDYRVGASTENAPMIALIKGLGCPWKARLAELRWTRGPAE